MTKAILNNLIALSLFLVLSTSTTYQDHSTEQQVFTSNPNNTMTTQILRKISQIVKAKPQMEGAGVLIHRTIGTAKLDYLDPFLLLDEFKSDKADEYLEGFPDHPHRGFETVTYMLEGSMEHRDHKGNKGLLGPGSCQWMTAGRGIVHSEMPLQDKGLMHGYQMWVNLPKSDKMCQPKYQDFQAKDIPVIKQDNGVVIKIMTGEVNGVQGAIKGVATNPSYIDVQLPPNTAFSLPVIEGHTAWCYIFEGSASFGSGDKAQKVSSQNLVIWEREGNSFEVKSGNEAARFLFAAARPLNEPMARYGPFVMNTQDEIMQAMRDFQSGRLQQ